MSISLATVVLTGCLWSDQTSSDTGAPIRQSGTSISEAGLVHYVCDFNDLAEKSSSRQRENAADLPSASRLVHFLKPNLLLADSVLESEKVKHPSPRHLGRLYSLIGDDRLLGGVPDRFTVEKDDFDTQPLSINRTTLKWVNERKQMYKFEFSAADVAGSEMAYLSRWNTPDAAEADFSLTARCRAEGAAVNFDNQAKAVRQ